MSDGDYSSEASSGTTDDEKVFAEPAKSEVVVKVEEVKSSSSNSGEAVKKEDSNGETGTVGTSASSAKTPQSELSPTAPPKPVKRGRGRPRKHPLPPGQTTSKPTSPASTGTAGSAPKRGRGRPRKIQTGEPPKKKRGRPPGSGNSQTRKTTPKTSPIAKNKRNDNTGPVSDKHSGLVRKQDAESKTDGIVFFYGDSLTWGMAHNYTGRYFTTWPQLLEDRFGLYKLKVVESALCSRTTVHNDSDNEEWMPGAHPHYFNGYQHFVPEFTSCNPKWLILLLGTNDLKERIRKKEKERTRIDASDIAANCAKIALKAREIHEKSPFHSGKLNILVVAPPLVKLNPLSRELGYDDTSVRISTDFVSAYEDMCKEHGFLFAKPEINMAGSVDGIHITEEANVSVAESVWAVMRNALGPPPAVGLTKSPSPSAISMKDDSDTGESSKGGEEEDVYNEEEEDEDEEDEEFTVKKKYKKKRGRKPRSPTNGAKSSPVTKKNGDEWRILEERRDAEAEIVRLLQRVAKGLSPEEFTNFVETTIGIQGRRADEVDVEVRRLRSLLQQGSSEKTQRALQYFDTLMNVPIDEFDASEGDDTYSSPGLT
mmetsp:Transcript_19839/g.32602  ORF Transcript_19839/g.32602 Transcript_19839/m.32602 type:complete len:597 (-) Transcript_19839:781-2571(-)|eukprot:CAMPEP_0203752274 /NCGR_PEP_ID=MMETSP0098-20131031/6209_1 /ASSEMBLY_ACC=CAM_ASM_000208 /TAXON_ID=96639 /ORGANISM=" , Strain NY0313808BC1" /LENGTH=596 /DNA_ID=CAMNT_0050642357 /DNA_START=138 /DNA_END=1928 /DNA_ORIENTATION=+